MNPLSSHLARRRFLWGSLLGAGLAVRPVARAAVDPIPADHTRYVGDVSAFQGK